jgi:GNAT superfamily N-acetyltransferase
MPIGPPLLAVEEVRRDRAALIEGAMGDEAGLVGLRFARGCRCFAVIGEGAIAGYGWLSTGPEWIGELQLEIRPGHAEAYIWNCVTLAEHRRRGVFRSLVAGIADAARGLGARRVWIGSVAIPAEKALAPSGFRPAARFHVVRFLGVFAMAGSILDPDARRVVAYRGGVRVGAVTRRRH